MIIQPGLIVEAHQEAVLAELQLDVISQLHFEAVAFLVDYKNGGTREVGIHLVEDRGGDEGCGNSTGFALYFYQLPMRSNSISVPSSRRVSNLALKLPSCCA